MICGVRRLFASLPSPPPKRTARHRADSTVTAPWEAAGFADPTAYRPSGGGRPLLLLEGSTQLRPFRLITASWVIGAYSMVFGAMLVGLSLRLRKHRHTSDDVPPS